MTDKAAARIEEMAGQNPDAVELARLLSFAVPIEPALLRAMRLELLPRADVSAEADLWFGPLVETRSRDGIMLFPEVAETLRADLKDGRAERCWRITERLHDYLPPAVQLEEKLNFLSIDPQRNAGEIDRLLQSALTALIGQARDEVANWAGRALPRLPPAVRTTPGAAMLAVASDLRLGRNFTLAEHLSGGAIPDWFAAVLPAGLGTTALGVSATSLGLMLDPAPGPQAPHIMLPATDPRVVQVLAGGKKQVILIDAKGAAQHVPLSFEAGPIELTTLAGEAFTLDRIAIPGTLRDRALASAAYADCNQALIVWQIGAPIDRCLGFALERIDASGQSEFLKNGVGFRATRSEPVLQSSAVWPLQRFRWIDRPPRRGTGAIYSYRVTPVVGVPPELELVKELEAVTGAVEVGVTRQGSITALFNREPGAAQWRPQTREARSEQVAREELGGEVRRALLDLLHAALVDEVSTVYVALSRLDDPELIAAVARLGRRASVILGTGRLAGETGHFDGARWALGRTQLYQRGKAQAYAHNHFMVVCRGDGRPRTVWTGSMSWTVGSLCGRDGNALIIDDPAIAGRYLDQWQKLRADPPGSAMIAANAAPATFTIDDGAQVTLWFAPQRNGAELAAVRQQLAAARTAILFALGPRSSSNSVFEDILARSGALYVAGIARSTDGKRVSVHQHGSETVATPERPPADALEAVGLKPGPIGLPVGSRLIVIDPFGDDPVVITGSHTLSEGSSRKNDEDLLIIRRNRALARACAVHVKGLIDHYAFRAFVREAKKTAVMTLRPNDGWQSEFMTGERAREIRFWMGALGAVGSPAPQTQAPDVAPRGKGPAGPKKASTKKSSVKKSSAKKAPAKKTKATKAKAAKKTAEKTSAKKTSAKSQRKLLKRKK
jgi:hypothetical protein